ncbi:MAG: hypothetical protein WDO74_24855 [Pseudomonadota bacterium]
MAANNVVTSRTPAQPLDGTPGPDQGQRDQPARGAAPEPAGPAAREIEAAAHGELRHAQFHPGREEQPQTEQRDQQQRAAISAEIIPGQAPLLGQHDFTRLELVSRDV